MKSKNKILQQLTSGWGSFILLMVMLFMINILTTGYHQRIDLTNEHRFTLTEGTKSLLKNIDTTITIDVFLKGDYPSGFRKLSAATEDILREFKELAGNKLQYRLVAPEELVDGTQVTYADTLDAMGIPYINLTAQVKGGQQQQKLYPVALMHYRDLSYPVDIFKGKSPQLNYQEIINAEALLEYQLAQGIATIKATQRIPVAYAIGNGEPMDIRIYDLAEETVGSSFDLQLVDLAKQPFVAPEFKALLIVKPQTQFTDLEKLKIDQYVMNGGKVLLFLDKLNAEMDSLQVKNEVIAYDRNLELNDLLFKYGARVNSSLLMDLQCDFLPFDVSGNGQFELLPWNYFPVLESPNNHPINKNLGYVSGKFVNAIDTVEAEGIRKTILLQSSSNARVISTPALISGKENVTAPESELYKTPNIPVAVLLEGKFTSLYRNRITREMNDSLAAYNIPFLPQCVKESQVLVVADGDVVMNSVVKGDQPLPMGMNPFTYGSQRSFPFVNRDFLLNALNYMIDDNGLSAAKNKEYVARLLDKKKLEENKLFWQLINILLPIMVTFLFAIVVQTYRKKKYTRNNH